MDVLGEFLRLFRGYQESFQNFQGSQEDSGAFKAVEGSFRGLQGGLWCFRNPRALKGAQSVFGGYRDSNDIRGRL